MADIIIDGTSGANRFLILDSTGKIPAVDGSQVTAIAAGNIATGTIPIARIDTGSTANKIVVLDGSGRLPAVSATLITNLSSSTSSASDPTISTNPSGGVGTEWHNTTSGEAYICTDVTAGENVWINVGAGTGNIQPYSYAGTIAGYSMGGSSVNAIDKYTFASDGNAVATGGTLTTNNFYHAAQSVQSSTAGYTLGGYGAPYFNKIEKFVFATSSNATNVGSITGTANGVAGCNDTTHGYRAAGWTGGGTGFNIIERFAFATDGACADVGDLIASGHGCSSSSTETHGYISGQHAAPTTAVQKFAFASSAAAVDTTQDLITWRDYAGSATSTTHGFLMGGNRTTARIDVESYAFASSAAMSDIGDMNTTVHSCSSSSSQTHGYVAGNGVGSTKAIQKIQLSSSATGTSVGNLINSKHQSAGCFQ